jgi:hypothetical protein
MPSIIPTASIDNLLEALDAADTAVRDIYRALADDPDLAPARDAELRDLHLKRAELARQVGMAALAQWRASSVVFETVAPVSTMTTPAEPVPAATASDMNGSVAATTIPSEPASEPTPPASPPAPPPLVEAPASAPIPPPPSSAAIAPPPASDAQLTTFKSKGLGTASPPGPMATPSASVQRPWPVTLHEMMCVLGPRETDLDDRVALLDELDALDEVATPDRQNQWVRLPIEIQKHWLSSDHEGRLRRGDRHPVVDRPPGGRTHPRRREGQSNALGDG